MSTIISQALNGFQLGAIFALVALGYSMVYGIISLLNFAHGDIIMVGAYAAWFIVTKLGETGLPFWLVSVIAVIITIAACTFLGMATEKVAYAPLRSAPRLSLLITAIGVSYLLENLAQLVFGASGKRVPQIISVKNINIGSFTLSRIAVLTLVVSLISMAALTVLVKKTKMGKAMRAVSEDMEAARLMGVNVNNTISFTFALGSALAGIGAILYCCAYPQISPTMGSMLGLKAFVAAVLGGIGSIPGAVIGGFAIGMAETVVSAIGLSVWKDAVVFLVLIFILIIKPAGIMGKKTTEKV